MQHIVAFSFVYTCVCVSVCACNQTFWELIMHSNTPGEHLCQSWPSDGAMTCWISEHAQPGRDKS